jgi:DNA-binding response OmpR family regulator
MLIGIVEGNPKIRSLLQMVLEYEHHQVEVLEHVRQRGTHDVVLIDPGAPASGFPLLSELEATPSIILTPHDAYFWPCEKRHLPLLRKPFHLKELVELVNQIGTGAEHRQSYQDLYPQMETPASEREP